MTERIEIATMISTVVNPDFKPSPLPALNLRSVGEFILVINGSDSGHLDCVIAVLEGVGEAKLNPADVRRFSNSLQP
jgi:hypothetical protein